MTASCLIHISFFRNNIPIFIIQIINYFYKSSLKFFNNAIHSVMNIEIVPVKSRSDLRTFIHLPAKIHKNHHNWVPPIYSDEWFFFNPRKNKTFSYSDTVLFLAKKDGRTVGRIMGIINNRYNDAKNEHDGRFSFLETYDDFEVALALLKETENWASQKGMKNLVGPLGFSDKDPQGMLIEGFDAPVVISSNANFPFMSEFLERAGYTKKTDLVVYKVIIPKVIPEFYRKIYERTLRNNPGLKFINIQTKKQIKPYIRPVMSLVNETFKDIYAFSEMSLSEMDDFAGRYLMILDPRFLKIIENEKKEVVAFVLGMPDISAGIIKSKGYIFPFGFISILRSQKTTKQLTLLLGAIREDYRNHGLNTILGILMLEEARKGGFEYLDSHLEIESNLKIRAEMEKMGGEVYKKYRIYSKPLSD